MNRQAAWVDRRLAARTGAHSRDAGGAAVEFALVLPILAILIFAIVDFGRLQSARIALAEAARDGARSAAVGGADSVRERVEQVADLPGAWVSRLDGCPVLPTPSDRATVVVSYDFTFITPIGVLFGSSSGGTMAISATGVAPCM